MASENFRRQISVLVPAETLRVFDEIIRGESRSAAVSRLMKQAIKAAEGGDE